MSEKFISESIIPDRAAFDLEGWVPGSPVLPRRFTWRRQTYTVERVLEQWKETGPCTHGSGERYTRKHWYRLQTAEGPEMKLYFERKARGARSRRWQLYSIASKAYAEGDPGNNPPQSP